MIWGVEYQSILLYIGVSVLMCECEVEMSLCKCQGTQFMAAPEPPRVVGRPVHGPVTIQITRATSPDETVSAAHGRVGLAPVPVS